MKAKTLTRGAGVLLPISSLPSAYGIGTLGNAAFRFVDLLVELKQKYWQILPMGPLTVGDSPFQSGESEDINKGSGCIITDIQPAFCIWNRNLGKCSFPVCGFVSGTETEILADIADGAAHSW